MQQLLSLAGSIAAILGILLCTISGVARLSSAYHLAGYEATTLFSVGTGLMVLACLAKLEALSRRSRD